MIQPAPEHPSTLLKARRQRPTLGVHLYSAATVASGAAVTIGTDRVWPFFVGLAVSAAMSIIGLAVENE